MWKKIDEIGHRIGFTTNETVVVVFLGMALFGGGIIRLFIGDSGARRVDYADVYRRNDSLFRVRSERIAPAVMDSSAAAGSRDSARSRRESDHAEPAPRSININTASAAELERLPGVGPSTAEKIIAHRKTAGKFRKIEDIMRVKSIGEKKFGRMKPYITVD